MKKLLLAAATTLAGATLSPAMAQDNVYVGASVGVSDYSSSDNSGYFTSDFTVAGTPLDGAVLPSGTPVGWNTEFDSGMSGSIFAGWDMGVTRIELELTRSDADVDTHSGVYAADIDLDTVDATVLVASTTADLGITTGALVSDGQGKIANSFLMLNAFYDFPLENSSFTPYIGGGIGATFASVEYAPSDTGIIDDEETVFAYQAIAGANYALNDRVSIFGEFNFRKSGDIEVDADLIPATFDIENSSTSLEVGAKLHF